MFGIGSFKDLVAHFCLCCSASHSALIEISLLNSSPPFLPSHSLQTEPPSVLSSPHPGRVGGVPLQQNLQIFVSKYFFLIRHMFQ